MRTPEKLDLHHYLSLVVCLGLRYKLDELRIVISICTTMSDFGELPRPTRTGVEIPETAWSPGKLGIYQKS